jgi:2-oxoglutarate ferredoxin oxidoreductase subunit alpha
MYNLLIGGAAGQGIDTSTAILERLFKRSGYNVFTTRDVMSRIRGGHNFSLIRFGREKVLSHSNRLDGIIAINDETIGLHISELSDRGFVLCDKGVGSDDPRVMQVAMMETAKNLGNPKVSGSVAIGAVLKLFGENLDFVREVMATSVKPQFLEINMSAIEAGYNSVTPHYEHIEGNCADWMILTGSKAMALGAMAAGVGFYSAYPMSPSTPVMEYLSSKMTEAGIVVEQAEDEIAAINMAIGASFAGVRAMTGTSGGGFSLMVEALGLSGMTEIPLVVANVQRPGPATGLPTRTEQSDLKFMISAAQGEFPRMVIALRDHEDSIYQTARAFEIAEKYQIPVILLSDQYLGDASATIPKFDPKRVKTSPPETIDKTDGEYLRYKLTADGISPRLIPGDPSGFASADSDEHTERGWITESAEVRTEMVDKRMKKLEKLREELQEPAFLGDEKCETLILGWGSTYGPIAEAVKILNGGTGGKFGALVFGDIYPLPTKLLEEKAATAARIINVEQNATGQLADLIREQSGVVCTSSVLKYDGRQITGEEIAARISLL